MLQHHGRLEKIREYLLGSSDPESDVYRLHLVACFLGPLAPPELKLRCGTRLLHDSFSIIDAYTDELKNWTKRVTLGKTEFNSEVLSSLELFISEQQKNLPGMLNFCLPANLGEIAKRVTETLEMDIWGPVVWANLAGQTVRLVDIPDVPEEEKQTMLSQARSLFKPTSRYTRRKRTIGDVNSSIIADRQREDAVIEVPEKIQIEKSDALAIVEARCRAAVREEIQTVPTVKDLNAADEDEAMGPVSFVPPNVLGWMSAGQIVVRPPCPDEVYADELQKAKQKFNVVPRPRPIPTGAYVVDVTSIRSTQFVMDILNHKPSESKSDLLDAYYLRVLKLDSDGIRIPGTLFFHVFNPKIQKK